ncbi:hypothetical protein [Candidatus Thiosymbion oneisti]|uniref:hypothetical protein n=1 Tax=Candidatus Thiosymbion oneisti TaxID=589554 RepID=UPI0013FD79A9|nr:hypothetical protein [Candidatus Thiosymbion oneisti]
MDSGLLWSAPAKRRGRIEPQRRGIPAALAKNLGSRFYAHRGDGAFPWPQRLAGDRGVARSKAAAGLQCTCRPPRLHQVPWVSTNAGITSPPHSKVSAGPLRFAACLCIPARRPVLTTLDGRAGDGGWNSLESIKSQFLFD